MASTYLNRTVASASNRRTWTYSAWIKRSGIGNTQTLLVSWSDGNNHSKIRLESDKVHVYDLTSGSFSYQVKTNRTLKDTSAWYHIVVAFDTTQSTASDRLKIYINGEQETSLAESSYPAEDYEGFINRNRVHSIGYNANNSNYFDGYMSHVALVDGTALTPTSFGQTDSTSGIWKFKQPTGITWGTNGFHLKFENSGALGTDSSGNTNTFTVNGNLKQSIDTPSNVYPTLNVLAQTAGNTQIDSANLEFNMTSDAGQRMYISTIGADTGKWYFEAKLVAKGNTGGSVPYIGAYSYKDYTNTYVGSNHGVGYNINGNVYLLGADLGNSGTTYDNGDIVGCALDITNSKVYFHKNGTYINSGNPSSGSNGYNISTLTAKGTLGLAVSLYDNNGNWDLNYGAGLFGATAITSAGSNGNGSLFEYDVPTGYYALNTKNLNTYG